MSLSTRHLLGIKDLTVDDIFLILKTAEQFKKVLQRPVKKVPSLRDVTIVNLFYDNSTRIPQEQYSFIHQNKLKAS